jgi:hypothetical protein
MPAEQSPHEQMVSGLWDKLKERAGGLGGLIGKGYDATPLSEDDEAMLWSRRALSVEQEWDLWRQGLTPEEIGMQVFPDRERLVKSGGRIEPSQWYSRANTLAARAERTRAGQDDQQSVSMPTEGTT